MPLPAHSRPQTRKTTEYGKPLPRSSSAANDQQSNALHGKEMRVREQPDYAWRMHQPNQGRKYNLFPSKSHEKLLITGSIEEKKDNFGRELAAAMAAIGVTPKEKPHPARAAASPKEQKLERRKKPSVTDLGLMAAIHEASMDSRKKPSCSDLRIMLIFPSYHTRKVSGSRALHKRARASQLETKRVYSTYRELASL